MAVDTVDPKDTEGFHGPVSSYQVVEAKPLTSDARFVAADVDGEEDGEAAAAAPAPVQKAAVKKPVAKQAAPPVQKQQRAVRQPVEDEQPERTSTKMYVALGAGLGVLTALAVVAFVLLPGKSNDTTYDMGSVTSTSNGLKGHLITNWGDRLDYKLTLEPSDPGQVDAFATTISNPPQAIQVNLQLKDVSGTVLCQSPILLKYDPLKSIPNVITRGPAPTMPKSRKAAAAEEMAQNQAEIEQSLNRARLVGQELSRETGKDIFQTVTGDDGQVASLAAQGTLPCTKKQYQNAASWSFVTNFPSILQQAGPQNSDSNDDTATFGGEPARNSQFSERRVARKAPLPNSHFSVEEDDALVGYQAATGIAETRAGKSFLVEKRDLVASALKGVEFPIPIHYRCDQLGACALAGLNNGIQRAWLER